MIAYQNAHDMLQAKSDERAMEMQARKPNMLRKQMLLNTVPASLEGLKGGAMPGLKRVVGGARKMKKAEEASRTYMQALRGRGKDEDSSDEEEDMEEVEMEEKPEMKGGILGRLGKLYGAGKMSKDAHDELVAMLGKKGGASPAGESAKTPAVNVYAKGIATKRVPPGGIRAKAEQGADYAPKWFRESGDIAGGALPPRKAKAMPVETPAPTPARGKRMLSDRQKARNAMVRKLMSEHGMKLGEASRYIKENNLI